MDGVQRFFVGMIVAGAISFAVTLTMLFVA